MKWNLRTKESLGHRRGTINIRDEKIPIPELRVRTAKRVPPLPKAELRQAADAAYRDFLARGPKPRAAKFEDLDLHDPHDQLAGVDLTQPPWD